jgi:hypothetical protein
MERSTLRTRKIIVNFVPVDRRGILNNAALLEHDHHTITRNNILSSSSLFSEKMLKV